MAAPVNPYFKDRYTRVTAVRWPHGGWIVWNWTTCSWDKTTDEDYAEIKHAEQSDNERINHG